MFLMGVGAVAGLGFVQTLVGARPALLCGGCVGGGRGDVAQRDFQRGLAIGLQDVAAELCDVADFGVRNLLFGPHEVGGRAGDLRRARSKVRAWPSSTGPMNMADMIGTIGLGGLIELFLVIADDD